MFKLELILKHPWEFFFICAGLALVLRQLGAKDFFPKLISLLENTIKIIWTEYKKGKNRSAIEDINFILVFFFGCITLVSVICLFIPSGVMQIFGTGTGGIHDSIKSFIFFGIFFFGASAIASLIIIKLFERESSIRKMHIPDKREIA